PASVLSEVSRLLRLFPALGTFGVSQPGAARSRPLALNAVGIVCALASEARHLGPIRLHAPVESLPDGTLVALTGMGSAAAARGAEALISAGAIALASFGLAGGLDPTLEPGAVLLPHLVVGSDGRSIATSEDWRERLAQAVRPRTRAYTGNLLTVSRAVGSIDD